MKKALLLRVLSVLVILAMVVPSSAMAITYQELFDQVYSATEDTTITLDEDMYQSLNDLNYLYLLNGTGVTITIDGNGHTIHGMDILHGIFRIINATIAGDDENVGLAAGAWFPGSEIDLTLDSSVKVLDSVSSSSSLPYYSVAIGADAGGEVRFQNGAQWLAGAASELFNYGGKVVLSSQQGTTTPFEVFVDSTTVLGANGLPEGVEIAAGTKVGQYQLDVDANGDGMLRFVLEGPAAEESKPVARTSVDREIVNGLAGSPFYLKRVYLHYMTQEISLYVGSDMTLFRQNLYDIGGATMMRLRPLKKTDDLTLSVTRGALEVLVRAGVNVLRVANGAEKGDPFVDYDTRILLKALEDAKLDGTTQVRISGPTADFMVVGTDGTLTKM